MAKRKAKSKSSPNTANPLPKSREALALLLQSTQDILAFLSPAVQAQETRLQHLRKTLKSPPRTPKGFRELREEAGYLKEVTKANRKRFAQGGPPLDTLKPYLASADLDAIIEKRQSATEQMHALTPRGESSPSLDARKPWVAAFGELVAADRSAIGLISELQCHLILALDQLEHVGADTSADKSAERKRRVPRDLNILRLAILINENHGKGRSQNELALQFTGGNKKRAQSLLRNLRRYPHLVHKRKK